jgi:Ca-activated chloride channel family protein
VVSLEWPWLLVLTPLPWLYRRWRRATELHLTALRAPAYAALFPDPETTTGRSPHHRVRLILLALIWLALLGAAARPVWTGLPAALPASGRDLLLAVDISGSMEMRDMESGDKLVDRLTAIKAVVGNFVIRRPQDRLGLILFGGEAYLHTPLTFDHQTLKTLLDEAVIGFAGDGTAIGDAIGLAVKRLRERPDTSRVLILLTDGANNAGQITPAQAAQLAATNHVRIYTIGIGADELIQRTLFGARRVNPSADLDEAGLRMLADTTGGRYFRARDPAELDAIYRELDRLEPVAQAPDTVRPLRSLAHWPLAVALFASLVLVVVAREDLRA